MTTKWNLWKTTFKKIKVIWSACLFLNTLSHLIFLYFILDSKNAIDCEVKDSKTQNKMHRNTSVIQTYKSTQKVLKKGLLILFFIATASVIVFWSLISAVVTPYKLHVINTICLANLNKVNGNNAATQLDKLNQNNQINLDNSNKINRNDVAIVPIKINQINKLNAELTTCQKEKLGKKLCLLSLNVFKLVLPRTLYKKDNFLYFLLLYRPCNTA